MPRLPQWDDDDGDDDDDMYSLSETSYLSDLYLSSFERGGDPYYRYLKASRTARPTSLVYRVLSRLHVSEARLRGEHSQLITAKKRNQEQSISIPPELVN